MSVVDTITLQRRSGVAVPLWSLRLDGDSGTGEFRHLLPFGDWCGAAGLDLIQLLPIHDSGTNTSPYSAVSAFALNPIYVDLSDLPGSEEISEDILALRRRYGPRETLAYGEIRAEKLDLARRLFNAVEGPTEAADLDVWMATRPWIRPYAAYVVLKERNEMRPWWEWGNDAEPSSPLIDGIWDDETTGATCRFLAWIQYHLQRQLDAVVAGLKERKLILKGDVPILMSRDSADVWWERRVFDLTYQAGAPPDMFSEDGQNWGFPVYNWDLLKDEDYKWWRDRLDQAERWFDAIRIDHVLGFFRIWAIPDGDFSAQRGHYRPAKYLTRDDFVQAGIGAERLDWLAEPHLTGGDLRQLLGDSFAIVVDALFLRLSDEDLYRFRPDIQGESAVARMAPEGPVRDTLIRWFRDRALIDLGDELYAPAWFADQCTRLSALSEEERGRLFGLFDQADRESSTIWRQAGYERLRALAAEKEFLACAEDLGAVPPVVPEVLEELSILGLRIPRWTRLWDQPGQPFKAPEDYEPLTVCTPSVHDTSTLRGWWEEEESRAAFWSTFGLDYTMPDSLSAADVEAVLTAIYSRVASVLCVSQLQDYLAMDPALAPPSVDAERVNWPGTTSERNWVYRMPETIENLAGNEALATAIRRVTVR